VWSVVTYLSARDFIFIVAPSTARITEKIKVVLNG